MDAEITRWINSFAGQSAFVDQIAITVTQVGVPAIVALVVLQWWSRHDRLHIRHAVICAGLSFLLGLAVNQLILLFLHRVRPYDAGVSHLLIARSADWSFPSDHATASMAVTAAFLMEKIWGRALVLFIMAFFVCLSRVYVGTHYLTDVLGGAATGVAAAVMVHFVYSENSRLDRFVTGIL